jgi:phosphoribosylformimino-5-aminoimidazole carboxamide ribotide isomerase
MKILPAIDLRHGRVVQLIGGNPDDVAVTAEGKPAEVARKWKRMGAKVVHVVDLDAALGGQRQWHHINAIRNEGVQVHFGGGIRSLLDIQKLIDLGVDRIILGTQAVENPVWLEEAVRLFPQHIVLAIDARGSDVQIKGWTESSGIDVVELARRAAGYGVAGILYTNIDNEGRMTGTDPDMIRAIRDAAPDVDLTISGGIASMEDLAVVDGLGADAVVLGMSIYTGAIDLADAVERFERLEPAAAS